MNCQCNEITEINGWEAKVYAKEHLRIVEVRNWEIEYECPGTRIHFLLDYPHGELQGGGPSRLRRLPIMTETPGTESSMV